VSSNIGDNHSEMDKIVKIVTLLLQMVLCLLRSLHAVAGELVTDT